MRWPPLLYALPVGATFVGAFLLLGPARVRPAIAARVIAAASGVGGPRSLRIVTVARLDRLEEPSAVPRIVVREGDRVLARTDTDAQGMAELALEGPVDPGRELVIEADGVELARGRLAVATAPDDEPSPTWLEGTADGALVVRARLARGAYVPPFPEVLELEVQHRDGTPVDAGTASLSLVGASPPKVDVPVERGRARLELVPEAPRIELEVNASATRPGELGGDRDDGEATAAGRLSIAIPGVMGGVWLDPSALPSKARLVAPSPRRVSFVSLHDARGRTSGAVIPLGEDADGFFRGTLELPSCEAPPCSLVAASDPLERGASTVAWPLSPREGVARRPPLGIVLDGVPAALGRERLRVRSIRMATIAGLSLVAAVEVFLLLRARRQTTRSLGEQLGQAIARDAARTERRMVAIAAALVALVFAALVAVSLR